MSNRLVIVVARQDMELEIGLKKDGFMQLDSHRKGIFFAIFSSLLFALRSSIIKSTPLESVETLIFFRFICDLLILSPLFFKYRGFLKTKRTKMYLGRSALVALSIYCSTYGIKHLALADALLLQYTLPLFIPLSLWIFYRKGITRKSGGILCLGFFSLCFLLKPDFDVLHLASLASLCVGFFGSIMAVSLHDLSKTDHVVAILFYSTLIAGGLTTAPYLLSWEHVPLSTFLMYIVPISLIGVVHQYMITRAYALCSPHVVGGFIYFSVLFGAFFGWMLFGEMIDSIKIFGGVLLVLSGLLMVRENNVKAVVESERP